jgi:citrate lyase beta subunit
MLSVPASNWRMIEKAVRSDADMALIDLEDAVALDEKVGARQNVVRAFRELDWAGKPRVYRINAVNTPFGTEDLVEIVGGAPGVVDLIVIPKVERPEEVVTVDTLVTQTTAAHGMTGQTIEIYALIETAAGILNVDEIAASSPRLRGLIFGPGDFAASMRMPAGSIGTVDEWDRTYGSHRFHYPMMRIAVAARSAGLELIDGPVADFRDPDGFRQSCLVARSLGYDGKWCIHPSQVPIANDVFAPTAEELAWAQRVVDAYEAGAAGGSGVTSVDGMMIDLASIRMAEATLALAQQAGITHQRRGS